LKRLLLFIAVVLSVGGCETSTVWYLGHPERKIVTVDGLEISVVPRRTNEFDAFGGGEGTGTNAARLNARQVRAIEEVSRCKVRASEYMPGTWTLQAVVTCSDASK